MIELDWKPDRGKLRVFGATSLVAFGAIGAWIFFRHSFMEFEIAPDNARITGFVLWGVAVTSGLLAIVAPFALRPLYVGLSLLTFPIGFVMSFVVLGVIYYGIFAPMGIFFRVIGRDTMSRRFDTDLQSYWIRRTVVTDPKRYFRQF